MLAIICFLAIIASVMAFSQSRSGSVRLNALKMAEPYIISTSTASSLKSTRVLDVASNNMVTLSTLMKDSVVVYGTYAADFNAIEYAQRLKYYLPDLKAKGIKKFHLILNASPASIMRLTTLLDIPTADIKLYSDEMGKAGRNFNVNLGWMQEDTEMNPYLKLFGMLFGLGAAKTLPSVIGGYIGNPFTSQPWIEDALAVGTRKGRFPTNALELSSDESQSIITNKFASLPVVGGWKRRPLELATLRLQNMVGVSLSEWDELRPSEEALKEGVLTQLGGLAAYDTEGEVKYEFRDDGICNVCRFEDLLDAL